MTRLSMPRRLRMKAATRVAFRKHRLALETGCLSLSFDDIPRSAWTEGGPILRRHGVRATFYLNGGSCGGQHEGREQFHQSDAVAMHAEGHEIGSHLFNHLSALDLTTAKLRAEIERNDAAFRDILGPDFRAESFAYPYGHITLGAKRLCSRRFSSCRGVRTGVNAGEIDTDHLAVLHLDRAFSDETDWEAAFRDAARDKAWIITLAHSVDDTTHPYGCSPALLDRVLTLARDAGLTIRPVSEVLASDRAAAALNGTAGVAHRTPA